MALTLALLTWRTVVALMWVILCNAGSLPPPTILSHKWLDPFTVNVSWSWEKPSNLPTGCDVEFEYKLEGQAVKRTNQNCFIENCLTEEIKSSRWKYYILATASNASTASPACVGWTGSALVTSAVHTQMPRAEVVKDFKCLLDASGLNCSWLQVNRSPGLKLTYRMCGRSEKHLKECDQYYTSGARNGCYFSTVDDICIHAATVAEAMTFKPLLVLNSPKLTVKQNVENLELTWRRSEVSTCTWTYELCFIECGKEKTCRNITIESCVNETRGECMDKTQMPYDQNCQYTFNSRVLAGKYCPPISSDFGEDVVFGINKYPNIMMIVVGIIVPFILSLTVVLAFYCVKKHYHIMFPTIPNPRALLKELMNGNNNPKASPANVYIPQLEHTESCRLVKEPVHPELKL